MEYAIEVRNLTKRYKDFTLDDISFALPSGTVMGLIGENGAGMRVKLEFAAALSHHPKLLILDEATSGLDPVFRDEILDILREFTEDEGHAILMSSHITSDLDKIADYIAYLHEGRIQFIKTYDEIRSDYGIITCGQELFDSLSRDDIAAYKKGPYSYQVLIKNRGKVRQVFQDIEIANASVEDIMLFCAKGEQVK